MPEDLPQFNGPPSGVLNKLNAMRDRVNDLSRDRGGSLLTGGSRSGLLLNMLRSRIPKVPPGLSGDFPIVVKLAGGLSGGKDTQCSYVYDGWVMDTETFLPADRILIASTPLTKRPLTGKHEYVPDDLANWGYATAFIGRTGDLLLLFVPGERRVVAVCTTG